jgi:membrane protease subunit (stomatin/prohibitin family)
VSLRDFLAKQFISVIQWNEPAEGILAYRYPMQDMEIENGGQLTVSESQIAAFVNEGKIADVFGPGLHTLNTRNPLADRSDELGQSLRIPVQVRGLLLLDTASN